MKCPHCFGTCSTESWAGLKTRCNVCTHGDVPESKYKAYTLIRELISSNKEQEKIVKAVLAQEISRILLHHGVGMHRSEYGALPLLDLLDLYIDLKYDDVILTFD